MHDPGGPRVHSAGIDPSDTPDFRRSGTRRARATSTLPLVTSPYGGASAYLPGSATVSPSEWLSIAEHEPDRAFSAGPVVVLVHGSLDRAASFTRVRRRLPDLHTVV